MTVDSLEQLRYPVGRFVAPESFSNQLRDECIAVIDAFPARLRAATEDLSDSQLDTPYRPGGWTIRQVIHHCGDSHMNALIRFKVALTEDFPTIKPYQEALCAELADYKLTPARVSLQLLDSVHTRWTILLRAMGTDDWNRGYVHPEMNRACALSEAVALYAWHCRHHLGHVTETAKAWSSLPSPQLQ